MSTAAGSCAPEAMAPPEKTGCIDELPIWWEWEKATKGKRLVIWSRGLRELLLGAEPELTDEEIAQAEVGGETVADLSAIWNLVRAQRGLRTELLEAAERGGLQAVHGCLVARGWSVSVAVISPPRINPEPSVRPGSGRQVWRRTPDWLGFGWARSERGGRFK